MTRPFEVIFFDAGFTLVGLREPEPEVAARFLAAEGIRRPPEAWAQGYREARAFFESIYFHPENRYWASDEGQDWFWTEYHRRLLLGAGVPAPVADRWAPRLAAYFGLPEAWGPYPEVPGTLAALREAGYRLGVISDWSRSLEKILAGLGLRPYFDWLFISGAEGVAKPDPALYRRAVERAGVLPAQALHVGDSPYADVQGARAAGLHVWLLDREGRHPDVDVPRLRSLAELPARLAAVAGELG